MHPEKYMPTVSSSVLRFHGSHSWSQVVFFSKNCYRQENIIDQKVEINYRTMGLRIATFNNRQTGRKINKEIDTQTNAIVKLEGKLMNL